MLGAAPVYRKLTRKRRTLSGSYQLWLGPDHILLASSYLWLQKYHRFRLADVQSIVLSERPSVLPVQVSVVLFLTVVLAVVTWATISATSKFLLTIVLGGALLVALVDLARGPYCRCVLNTAVTSIRLPAVSRLRAGRRFLDQARPAIEAVQGTLGPVTAGQITASFDDTESMPGEVPEPAPSGRRQVAGLVTFGAFLLLGITGLAGILWGLTDDILWAFIWVPGALVALGIYGLATWGRSSMVLGGLLAVLTVASLADAVLFPTALFRALVSRKSEKEIAPETLRGPYPRIAMPVHVLIGVTGLAVVLSQRRRKRDSGEQTT
jgi:hypothetical protein